jgi:hypothetical protein
MHLTHEPLPRLTRADGCSSEETLPPPLHREGKHGWIAVGSQENKTSFRTATIESSNDLLHFQWFTLAGYSGLRWNPSR